MTLDMTARYSVAGYRGVAFWLKGYAQQPEPTAYLDGDFGTDYDGEMVDDPENVVAVMVGDDREHVVPVEDLTVLADGAYCGQCGQIGCTHDGRE